MFFLVLVCVLNLILTYLNFSADIFEKGLAFYAPSNLVLRHKNAQIMLDSQNNATLVPENAQAKRRNSGIMCAYHRLNKARNA